MSSKGNQVVGWLVQLLIALRPRTYNRITTSVVLSGLLLVWESQVKLVHAVIVVVVEMFIGESELLRAVLTSTSDTFIGMSLITMGLIYHLTAEYLQSKKATLPAVPSLSCHLLNGDKESLDTEFTLRGKLALLPPDNEIPDKEDSLPTDDSSVIGQALRAYLYSGQQVNTQLYRERADVLNEWAGAELIYLVVENEGKVLATGVSVQLSVPRAPGVLVKPNSDIVPPLPKATFNRYEKLLSPEELNLEIPARNELTLTIEGNRRVIHWQPHKLQAGTSIPSEEAILIKTNEPIEVECTIFCDELPEPIVKTFHVNPPSEEVNVYLSQLKNEERYDALCDELIMGGYIDRIYAKFASMHEDDY
ncbi:hypothetical protein J6I75_08555 [Pseudidiomarina sp. 1APP75-27a]|uniref:hypothetical protein n=1 Tax=Pseudidiomarina terrestris TaxID=2820060 RepID=UPI002B053C65|nr:hypothetical protein [Pseudidiomarina sp. 1APP75-27a]MEA3588401.1 hypothetical protein [Pseudidiomarina sp. 1APP75-27a]